MHYRDATLADAKHLYDIGAALISDQMKLRPSREKLQKYIATSISATNVKFIVATEGDTIVGAMLTLSDKYDFAEKQYAQIIGVYSKGPRLAEKMLCQTLEWAAKRRAIQMICYSATSSSSFDDLLYNYKFKSTGSMLVRRRYGTV